jgi:hypothetical protein
MVGFDEDVELGFNQDRICSNYVRIGCVEEGGGRSLLQPLKMVWLCVPAAADHEKNEVSLTRLPLVLIPFRDLLVFGRYDFV